METANNFTVETTLPALKFDYGSLRKWVEDITAKYKGLVVREEDVKDIKKDMAELNKAAGSLDDARKEAVRQVSVPIKEFETRIKELVDEIKKTRSGLDQQVKAYEKLEKEQKRQEIEFMIDYLMAEHEAPDVRIEIESSWLNKSTNMKSVQAAIEAAILGHLKAKREAAELEQAKKDRAVAIEQQCERMAKECGFNLPPSQFLRLHDLSIPLEKVLADVENAYQFQAKTRQAEPMRRSEDYAYPLAPDMAPRPRAPMPPSTPKAEPVRTILIEVSYTDRQTRAVETALRNLQSVATSARIVESGEVTA
jgi:DNA repair exonuclease SbcCD ATPase subunit